MPRRTNNDPVARAFGDAVRAARQARGLSIETVAGRIERVGREGKPTTMDAKYLQSIERGFHSPTISTALQIAGGIGVPLSVLVEAL